MRQIDADNFDNCLSHFEIGCHDSVVEVQLSFDRRSTTAINQYSNSGGWTRSVIVGADQSMTVLDEYVLGLERTISELIMDSSRSN